VIPGAAVVDEPGQADPEQLPDLFLHDIAVFAVV
jgi:hypothetical protein